MAEQLDPRKPFAPLQNQPLPQLEKGAVRSQTETETTHGAAQQEMTDITTAAAGALGSNTLVSDPGPQPRTSLGKSAEQSRCIDRPDTDTAGTTQESHIPPPRRHSTRVSRPPRRLIEEF